MRTALIVVDMQNGFVHNDSTVAVVPRVVELVDACASSGVDVVFTRFVNRPGSAFERLLGWVKLQAPPATDIVPELAARAERVLEKHHYSAFTPEFEALAAARGWQRLLLCGIATDACVLKTAFDAFERGLTPLVVMDACASNGGEEAHEAGLRVLRRCIGESQIVDTAQAYRMLAGTC